MAVEPEEIVVGIALDGAIKINTLIREPHA